MKDFFDEAKSVLSDSDNRGILKILKWISVLLLLCIPGIWGFCLALILVFAWKIPKKSK